MNMDELIFEMGHPNEIITTPEWTEWWAVDETGLHLEYADGYEPGGRYDQYTPYDEEVLYEQLSYTDSGDSKSIVIHVDEMYERRLEHIRDRWEEVFGTIDYKQERLDDTEKEIDEQCEPKYHPYPIMEMADHEHYLDYLRDAIDQYNDWYGGHSERIEELDEELEEDSEERVIPYPTSDGLILPTPSL